MTSPLSRSERKPTGLTQAVTGALVRVVDRIDAVVHPTRRTDTVGPNRITHERPFFEAGGRVYGAHLGVTVSELHQLRAKRGVELIQVVDADGNSNIETVLWRREIGKQHRVELQGPALNTRISGGLPLDVRLFGFGLTRDVVDPKAKEAVSYTFEAKLHTSDLVMLGGTGAAAKAAALLDETADSEIASAVTAACAAAVPVVGVLLAMSSARWAHKVLKNPRSTVANKVLAVTHAIADAVRIGFPLTGTLANAALVGVAVWWHQRERAAARSTLPASPPPLPPAGEAEGRAAAPGEGGGSRLSERPAA